MSTWTCSPSPLVHIKFWVAASLFSLAVRSDPLGRDRAAKKLKYRIRKNLEPFAGRKKIWIARHLENARSAQGQGCRRKNWRCVGSRRIRHVSTVEGLLRYFLTTGTKYLENTRKDRLVHFIGQGRRGMRSYTCRFFLRAVSIFDITIGLGKDRMLLSRTYTS